MDLVLREFSILELIHLRLGFCPARRLLQRPEGVPVLHGLQGGLKRELIELPSFPLEGRRRGRFGRKLLVVRQGLEFAFHGSKGLEGVLHGQRIQGIDGSLVSAIEGDLDAVHQTHAAIKVVMDRLKAEVLPALALQVPVEGASDND